MYSEFDYMRYCRVENRHVPRRRMEELTDRAVEHRNRRLRMAGSPAALTVSIGALATAAVIIGILLLPAPEPCNQGFGLLFKDTPNGKLVSVTTPWMVPDKDGVRSASKP